MKVLYLSWTKLKCNQDLARHQQQISLKKMFRTPMPSDSTWWTNSPNMHSVPQLIRKQIQYSKKWHKPIHTRRAPDNSNKCTAPLTKRAQWTLSKASPNICNNQWARPCKWCLDSRWTKQSSTCRPQCKQWIMLITCKHFSRDKEPISRLKVICQECHNRPSICN